jgi:carboxyl-terminal processing protease
MNRTRKLAAVAFAATALLSTHRDLVAADSQIKPGDTVVVVRDTHLQAGPKKLAPIQRDTELVAGQVLGDWIAVTIVQHGKDVTGWVLARNLARVPTRPLPEGQCRQIMLAVGAILPVDHVSQHPLDVEIARRRMDLFLRHLDPAKRYFRQSDADAFMLRVAQLDKESSWGDMTLAHDVFDLFLQRVDEWVTAADELLSIPHDFTIDEQAIVNPEHIGYAQTVDEQRERWRKRVKYDVLSLKIDALEGRQAESRLGTRYHRFQRNMHQIGTEQLMEFYLTSLASAFDPHTSYMSPSTVEEFKNAMKSPVAGIGISLETRNGDTIVRSIIRGGSAHQEGNLRVGDKVVGVGEGVDGELVDTIEMTLTEVVKLVRGDPGTVIRLEVLPANGGARKVLTITRADIALGSQQARSETFDVGVNAYGQAYTVGIIDLPSFYFDLVAYSRGERDFQSSSRDVRRILAEFDAKNVDAVVLD